MKNYTNPLPIDQGGNPLQEFPTPIPAKVSWASENANVSSVLNLGHNTTSLEVATGGTGAAIKWIATGNTSASVVTAAGTANYDQIIPANWIRRLTVPIEVVGNPTSIQGVNRANGLYQRIAWKTLGVASVFLSEY